MQQSLILLQQYDNSNQEKIEEGRKGSQGKNREIWDIVRFWIFWQKIHDFTFTSSKWVTKCFNVFLNQRNFGKYLKKSVLSGLGWNWMVCQTFSVEAPEHFLSHPYLFSGVAPSNKTFSSSFLPSLSFDCWSLWNIWDSQLSKVRISPWQSLWSSHTIRHWTEGLSAPWKERSRNEIWSLTF